MAIPRKVFFRIPSPADAMHYLKVLGEQGLYEVEDFTRKGIDSLNILRFIICKNVRDDYEENLERWRASKAAGTPSAKPKLGKRTPKGTNLRGTKAQARNYYKRTIRRFMFTEPNWKIQAKLKAAEHIIGFEAELVRDKLRKEKSQKQKCDDPQCQPCKMSSPEFMGFAQTRDDKIKELCETTDLPLWSIARRAGVDEEYVIGLCKSLGLEKDVKIGGPKTWVPLFIRPRKPRRLKSRLRRRNPFCYNY